MESTIKEQRVSPTADIPFFQNVQSYPLHIPTPNGASIDLQPGEVVIGKYFLRSVDKTGGRGGLRGNTSVKPLFAAVEISRIRDPIGLMDDLLAGNAPGDRDLDLGERRGTKTYKGKTADEWRQLLSQGRSGGPEAFVEMFGKTTVVVRVAKFLGVEIPDEAAKSRLSAVRFLLSSIGDA